jgi:hypothetical protein
MQTNIMTTDVVAAGAAAQKLLAPAVPVIELGAVGGVYGSAPGAPSATHANTVSDAITAVGVATSLTPAQQAMLTPDSATVSMWLGGTNTPTTEMSTFAENLVFTFNAFRLGLVGTVVMSVLADNPKGYFAGGPTAAGTASDQLAGLLQAFFAALAGAAEPSCSHAGAALSLADNVAFIITGDTPKDPFTSAGWPDGTPENSNWIFFRSNGWLKPGWFGQIDQDAGLVTFAPQTGALGIATKVDDSNAASLAILFAIARGHTANVTAVSSAPYEGAVSPNPP